MTPGIWRPDKPVQCDFCSSLDVVRWYQCCDFNSDSEAIGIKYAGIPVDLNSIGEWASCGQCSELIEAMDLQGLVDRALNEFKTRHHSGVPTPYRLRQHIAYTFELFFTNKV